LGVHNKCHAKACLSGWLQAIFQKMRRHLTFLIAGLALVFHPSSFAQTPPKAEALAKVRLTLQPDAPAIDAAAQESLVEWLSNFQDTIYRMRIRDYLEMIDWDTLIDKSYAGEADKPDATKKLLLKKSMMVASERMFPMLRPFFQFKDAEIRRLDLSGDNAVIIARTHDEDDAEYKLRWWLQRHDGKWQMTDFENITVNMRFSALLQMGFQAAASKEGFGFKKDDAAKLVQMGMAMQEGEMDKAYALLKELETSKFPALHTEMFLVAKAGVLSQFDDKKPELEATLIDLEKAAPDNPVLFLLRASGSYTAFDYKNTIVWAKKIGASVGHDEDTWSMLTDSHRELKEDKEYLAAAEGWAADYPNSTAALWSLWQALPEDQRNARVKPLLVQLTPAEEGLTIFAEDASDENDVGALKLVLDVMKTRQLPKEILANYQSALEDAIAVQKSTSKDKK
jgi:hypothetical protein